MSTKLQYRTKHKDELLEYLAGRKGEHVTVAEVCDYFRRGEHPIGTTTVYRQLERLVDEGLVNKYILDANSPACFEYVGQSDQRPGEVCFHCKCERCGKLIHLHCDELKGIAAHLKEDHRFVLDPLRTVFYGLCEECADD